MTQVLPSEHRWTVCRELTDYSSALEIVKDNGTVRFDDIDIEVAKRAYERYSWVADEFESPKGETEWTITFSRGGWAATTVTRTTLSCTDTDFVRHAQIDGYESGKRTYSNNWSRIIPRSYV